MNFDVFTISALVDEFMDTLVGGRVQDSIDVEGVVLGLEVYADRKRRYLYLSADNQNPRVHVVPDKLRRGRQRPTQLGLLVRRYVEGGIITHVSQPDWERILHIDIHGPEGEVTLVIEPMPRRANILLLRDGTILDCMRRVGPEDNRYRLSLPGHAYVPPPPMTGRRSPFEVTADDIHGFYQQNQDPKRKAAQVLSGRLLGVGPLLGKEIIFRAAGDSGAKAANVDPDTVYAALTQLMSPLRRRDWQPGVASMDSTGPTAFSAYPLEQIPDWQPRESMSAALADFYGAPLGIEAYDAAKQPAFAAIGEARARLGAKLASLERSITDESQREDLKQAGELILAYQYSLQQGQTELRAHYDPEQPELVITLDPKLSPLENAQRYFDRYNKAKRALNDVPRLIAETQAELGYVEQLALDLKLAASWPEIDEVQQVLQARGYWQGKKAQRIGGGGQSAPIRVVTDDGYVIWVGRNSRQNEIVSFKKAGGEDFWLHVRDVPGAHVIIKHDGRRVPEDVIETAASLAAYYSALRDETKVPVDVTRIKYVRKIKGAAPGMVTYRNESTRLVAPRSEHDIDPA